MEEIVKQVEEGLVAVKAETVAAVEAVRAESVTKEAHEAAIEEIKADADAKVEAVSAELKEGFAKMEAQLDALAPVAETKEVEVADNSYVFKGDKEDTIVKSINILKAENATNSTTGSMEGQAAPYIDLLQGNLFRGLAYMHPVSAGATFKLPKFAAATVNKNGTAGSFTESGADVTSTDVAINDYSMLSRLAENIVDDISGLDAMVGAEHVQRIAVQEQADCIAALDGATITEVNTGVAANNPTSFSKYIDLAGALGSQYWNTSTWVMSREAWTNVRGLAGAADGSDLAVDPTIGAWTLLGRPVMVSEEMDAGTTANDNSVYFGDFRRGLIIGARKDMQMRRSWENSIGHYTYYSNMRSGQAVKEAAALVRFNTAA